MNEKELRQKVVEIAKKYVGCKESDGSHRKIVDLYNSHKPLARGYPLKYTDAWCSGFASAVAIEAGLTDIIPTEVGCGKHVDLFKEKGRWVENDAYVPAPGDYIFYDWDDGANYKNTDNVGGPDHVGIVCEVSGGKITVIEGNKNNAVGFRTLDVNGRYIRGFGVPDYAAKADKDVVTATKGTDAQKSFINKIGPLASADMAKNGILASLTIAQAILESGWGKSGLTTSANNLFGIKGTYNGEGYTCKTQEWDGSKYITIDATFRKYPSWAESLADHTGDYRRNWKSDRRARRSGKKYIVRFYNPLDYAGHLEHGFRSHFVPGHWEGFTFVYSRDDPEGGMFVGPKGGYVRGRFTMKRAAKRTLDTQQARVTRKIDRAIKNRIK